MNNKTKTKPFGFVLTNPAKFRADNVLFFLRYSPTNIDYVSVKITNLGIEIGISEVIPQNFTYPQLLEEISGICQCLNVELVSIKQKVFKPQTTLKKE